VCYCRERESFACDQYLKRENGEDAPTEEEIRKQIFLPKVDDTFKEPIKEWIENTTSDIVPGESYIVMGVDLKLVQGF
jgi:hypothetical protein